MGVVVFRVTCTACSFEAFSREGPSSSNYELPDGRHATVAMAPAWCADCQTVVDAEVVPELDDLQRELTEFESGGPARDQFLKDAAGFDDPDTILQYSIAALQASVAWRKLRASPPRCLTCGSHALTFIPWDSGGEVRELKHPACGGELNFAMHALGSIRARAFTIDGIELTAVES